MPQYRQIYEKSDDDHISSPVPVPGGPPYAPAVGEPSRVGTAEYTLYTRRWLLVAILGFVNVSSALAWISFAPVAGQAAVYLNTTDANVNWLSTVYMVTTVPVGFCAVWLLDTCGLAVVIFLGACCNTLGLVIRYLSVFNFFPHYKYAVVITGQAIASLAQPCFLFTPTKVAALWFPESQRALANTLGSTSNPLGILLGLLISPMVVSEPKDVGFLLFVYMVPGVVSGVLAVVVICYCKSMPPSPPSASAASHHESFFSGLKKIVCIKAFWVLFFVFGAGLAVFNSITSLMEEVLCPHGYTDDFSGMCGAIMIGSGIVGAFLAGFYVDRSKKFGLVAKVSFALSAISGVAFAVISRYPHIPGPIIASCACLGFFGFAQFPVSLELGVEATYPVAEGTSAGFLIMSGQIQGFILMFASEWLAQPLTSGEQTSNTCVASPSAAPTTSSSPLVGGGGSDSGSQDMTVTMLFYGGYAALAACIYILAFHTKYRRMRAEQCNAADHILNFSQRNFSDSQNIIF